MVMETASADDFPNQDSRRVRRRLWQVPAFLTGLLAIVIVWFGRPFRHEQRPEQLQHDLAAARRALHQPRPEAERALRLAQGVLAQADRYPQVAGEAQFLLGSAYLVLAEQASATSAEPWQKARTHLEQAEALGVPQADRDRLSYRLGKAWYYTGADPRQIIAYLSRSLDQGADDLVEGYGMLAQAYLRLPQPDLAAALEANRKQLALPTDNEDQLAPGRLLRGELLLRLQQREQARLVLSCIKRGAPTGIHARARQLIASSYQDDERWLEAQKMWEEILEDPEETPPDPGRVLYYLGLCHLRRGKAEEAAAVWQRAAGYAGEGSQAAALRLAELHLSNKSPVQAWKAYQRALAIAGLTPQARQEGASPAYHNSLVTLEEARKIFEEGCQVYRSLGEYELSRKLAELYACLAPPGVAQELMGQALDAWAQHLEEGAGRATSKPPPPFPPPTLGEGKVGEGQTARARYGQAGRAYEAAANAAATPEALADRLWRAAERYRRAGDYSRALSVLRRFLALDVPAQRLGEGWFALAGVHQALKQEQEAREAYHKCVEVDQSGPFAFRARYQLALMEMQHNRLDEAQEILKQNLELMDAAPDSEAHEKSLFALADLLYRRGDYRLAALRWQEALDRYPANSQTIQARQRLADCYRRLAWQELQRVRGADRWTEGAQIYNEQYCMWQKMAAAHYQKLKEDLLARQAKAPLSKDEQLILREAEFAEAECHFYLGHWLQAIDLYEILARRYDHRGESLDALAQLTRCFWSDNNQPPEVRKMLVRKTLDRISQALKDMEEAALSGSAINHSRREWQEWLAKQRNLAGIP